MLELEEALLGMREYAFYVDFLQWKAGMEESETVLANIAARLEGISQKFLTADSAMVR